jgi:L-rhamnose isomerase
MQRVHIGLDFFDASINRVAAWVVGARNMRKALLLALLEPKTELQQAETSFDWTARLVLFEEQKSMPWQAVWEYYCASKGIAHGSEWLQTVRKYESEVLNKRV